MSRSRSMGLAMAWERLACCLEEVADQRRRVALLVDDKDLEESLRSDAETDSAQAATAANRAFVARCDARGRT